MNARGLPPAFPKEGSMLQDLFVSHEALRRAIGIAFGVLLLLIALLYYVERDCPRHHPIPEVLPTSPVTLKIALWQAPTDKAGVFLCPNQNRPSGAVRSAIISVYGQSRRWNAIQGIFGIEEELNERPD
jgi:hypothetical protein